MTSTFRRIAAASVATITVASAAIAVAQEPLPTQPDGPAVRARGPVHEAFARPADGPTRGPVVPKEPPAPVKEVPPDQRPDLEGVQWIPGYWAWDDETSDFLWVSGCWRVPPPGRQWVVGSWSRVDTGWRWLSGYWTAAGANAPQPVPDSPPASLEVGPSTPAPDENGYYVPGQWLFQNGEWVWQPGSWVQNQADMVYVPPTYLPAQNGSLYNPGYWDYPLQNRGMLFAPVAFGGTPWLGNPGWAYQPGYTVGLGGLLGSLFARPGYGNYYFGNYFGNPYQGLGYTPWTAYGRRGYDPLLNYYRWANRGTPAWYGGLSGLYAGRLNGSLPVPPAVYSGGMPAAGLAPNLIAQHTVPFGRGVSVNPVNSLRIVQPLSQANHVRLTSAGPGGLASPGAFPTRQSFASPAAGGFPTGPAALGRGVPLTAPTGHLAPAFAGPVSGAGWRPTSPGFAAPALHSAPVGHAGYAYHSAPGQYGGFARQGFAHQGGPVHHAGALYHAGPIHQAGPSFHGGHMGGGHIGGGHIGGGHMGGGHGGGHHR